MAMYEKKGKLVKHEPHFQTSFEVHSKEMARMCGAMISCMCFAFSMILIGIALS